MGPDLFHLCAGFNTFDPMTDKFRKIDKEYVLSDSSVNEYGFRLLTDGYQIDSFRKNPIGYYMHRREDGVALKWEDLRVAEDKVIGTPVINLSNARGGQLFDEAENGFLNAASVGHIVVLEYSTDPEMMLPGQTGPTITKWYNKECSLVDIPGNCNALTKLYDAQENEINLVDLGINSTVLNKLPLQLPGELYRVLNLADAADEQMILDAVNDLSSKKLELEAANIKLQNDKTALQQKLDELKTESLQSEVGALLDKALDENKITNELREHLAADYASNPEGLKALLDAMPAYQSIVDRLKLSNRHQSETEWKWEDYESNDPAGKKLEELKAADPERYKKIFDERFLG